MFGIGTKPRAGGLGVLGSSFGPAILRPRNVVERLFSRSRPGLPYLAKHCNYLFFPALRWYLGQADKAHYLYTPTGDVDPTALDTVMGAYVGTLAADGTGGSLSYTPEVVSPTMVEGFSILHTDGSGVIRPLLSFGFDRELTAGERTALSGATLIAYIADLAGVDAGDCSALTEYEYQQMCSSFKVDTTKAGSASDTFVLPTPGSGSYDYTVDWGNGDQAHVTANTSQTKDYNEEGTFVVSVYGTFPRVWFNNGGDKAKVLVWQPGTIEWSSFYYAFSGCSNLTTVIGSANCGPVTLMNNMFHGCSLLASIDFSGWDTSSVTSMYMMFKDCEVFNTDVSALDVSACTNTQYMFAGCTDFDQDLSTWDTSSIQYMTAMFKDCKLFNQDLSAWDTSACLGMSYMFQGATVFNGSLSGWDTSNVTTMASMFGYSSFNQSVSHFDTSKVTTMSSMFISTPFNQSVSNFDTSNVTNMDSMFMWSSFNQSVSNFDTSKVTTTANMFYDTPFNQSVSNFDTSNVTLMNGMFRGTPFNQSVSNFDTSKVTSMQIMFYGASSFNQDISGFDITSLTNADSMLTYTSFSQANYDLLLVAWEAQVEQPNVPFSVGTTKYSAGLPATARAALVASGWTITDGGQA